MVIYEDNEIRLDERGITIKFYYFPLATSKFIPWKKVKTVHEYPLTFWNGKWRAWGMGLAPYWFNIGSRVDKRSFLAIDTGSWIKSAITPSNLPKVKELIEAQQRVET